jgi:hypothetical protein
MIIWGNVQRWCHGGWVLAALILISINGFGFLSIEGQTVEGYSPLIKSLQQKLTQLENQPSVQKVIAMGNNEIRHLFVAYHQTGPDTIQNNEISNEVNPPSKAANDAPILPSLNGIIQMKDSFGSAYYTALIDGRPYREKERVKNFVVTKISLRGIELSRSGKRWFIQCPDVYYSIDRGE